MAKKAPPKKKTAARRSAPPAPFPAAGKKGMAKKKPKIPSLGGGLMGLGGTGAQGMMP